jgi:hypothetical protein
MSFTQRPIFIISFLITSLLNGMDKPPKREFRVNPVQQHNMQSSEQTYPRFELLKELKPWHISQPLESFLYLLPGDVLGMIRSYILGRVPQDHKTEATTRTHTNQLTVVNTRAAVKQDPKDCQKIEEEFILYASINNEEGVKRLLGKVYINAQDARGFTAFMLAARNGYLEMVKLLLAAGARTDIEQIEVVGRRLYTRTVYDLIPDLDSKTIPIDPETLMAHNFLVEKYKKIRDILAQGRVAHRNEQPRRASHGMPGELLLSLDQPRYEVDPNW